jgi:hypothetical protein
MADTIVTVTATISESNPAVFTVGGDTVDIYGSFSYQWDVTTGLLVNPGTGSTPTPPATQFVTGTITAKDITTGSTTTFTNPTFNFSGAAGGIAEIYFGTATGGNLNNLYLDWVGENPTTLYTGTNPVSGGAQYSSIKQTINGSTTTYHISSNGGAISTVDTCFAAGTLITTTKGEIAVEDLMVGDIVVTADGAEETITWLGHRDVKVTGSNADAKYLVRIATDAVAPGVPRRDLLVTQEHCLLLDGVLVPARMLVNDATITLDRSITSYTYYHVELERHAVILAEGLATESYLDTGNRGNFANADMVAMVPAYGANAGHKAWSKAAAPLAVDRATVEPIWRRLADRAAARGLVAGAPVLTEDAGLHLVTEAGQALWPVAAENGRFLFMLPPATNAVRLRSRASRPSDVAGPFVDDRRMLGVQVGEMRLTHGRRAVALQAEHAASGWHVSGAAEQGRWTNGDAALAIPGNNGSNRLSVLEIQILAAGPFVVEETARIAA